MSSGSRAGPPGHGGARPPEAPLIALSEPDLAHLERAILLGRRGWGRVHPNPMVGCVLVRDGRVLSEAWHEEFGGPHAEAAALERSDGDPAGATAYVSLEPCKHHGKTPACTDVLLRAGVSRVVFAVADPHPAAGGGGPRLRSAGIRVDGPAWPLQVGRRENPSFFHTAEKGRPFVAIKLALSLDGMIGETPERPTQLTGADSSVATHRLRAGFDAVLVGARTARVDDPRLTVREGEITPRVPPARMVMATDGSLPEAGALLRQTEGRGVVFVGTDVDESHLERLEAAGAEVHRVSRTERGLDLASVLDVCAATGRRSILCEGGGRLATSILAEGLAGRLYLFRAPVALGSGAVPGFPGPFPAGTWEGWRPAFESQRLGQDVLTVYDREA